MITSPGKAHYRLGWKNWLGGGKRETEGFIWQGSAALSVEYFNLIVSFFVFWLKIQPTGYGFDSGGI